MHRQGPVAERLGIPHHLIDIVEPIENFTAGEYARFAAGIRDIESRAATAIFVGGTGFYLRALLRLYLRAEDRRAVARAAWLACETVTGRALAPSAQTPGPASGCWRSARATGRALCRARLLFSTGNRMSDRQPEPPPTPEFTARITRDRS